MTIIRRLTTPALLLLLPLLFACDAGKVEDGYKLTDISGADFGREFELIDHDGKLRHLTDFRGKAVVMFFGFTHCPDICPTTLAEFNVALTKLGESASDVQVLFVTVDPERDTREVLRGYVTAFNPAFLGLTGSPEQIAKVAREFRIIYQKVEGAREGSYSVDHSAGTYIFDAQGRLRLYASYGLGGDVIAGDLKRLLEGG